MFNYIKRRLLNQGVKRPSPVRGYEDLDKLMKDVKTPDKEGFFKSCEKNNNNIGVA